MGSRPRNTIEIIIAAGIAGAANLVMFAPLPLFGQAVAAVALATLVPGWLLVSWLLGGPAQRLPEPWERSLYAMGAGFGVAVSVLLLLSYLPGPLTRRQALLAFDALVALLALAVWLRPVAALPEDPAWPDPLPSAPRGWLFAGMLTLVLVGGGLRFADLGYSEFQGDEARAVLRSAETIQGYSDALLSHRKGPAEILIPTTIYALVERLNEAMARLPFALANLAALFGIFLLGWRLFHPVAGWAAAMLLALDGYFIGFARIVQYQSIVFLTVVLVVLALYRLVQTRAELARYLTLAAILLATGLLAHYEAALAVFPGLYLLYVLARRVGVVTLAKAMLAPVVVGGALLAAFYVPFMLNPSFGVTYAYITVNRIGSTFPYNNLSDVFERTTLYSTVYYVALMTACALVALARIYIRGLRGRLGWVAAGVVVVALVAALAQPAWLKVGGADPTWAIFALAVGAAWFLPRFPTAERVVWAWFGAPLILMLFFTLTPNTHVYGFFIGWALVAGMVVGWGWQWLAGQLGFRRAAWVAAPITALLVLLFGNYAYWYFAATNLEVLRTWRENRPWGYPVSYTMPTRMSIFGFPLKNGWKAVGALIADGTLDGPFELHGKEPVADWYTRGQGYCPRDHEYYLWHESVEPGDRGFNHVVAEQIEGQGYKLWGEAEVNGRPRLRIYTLGDAPATPQRFPVEAVEVAFDHDLSGPIFENDGPSAAAVIQHPLDLRIGESIRLLGYSLDRSEAGPGEAVRLTLYWQATAVQSTDYSVFTQIIDMADYHKAGQRDGEPVCNNLPTSFWRPGDTIVDRYTIPIFPDAPPGRYTLLAGMYDNDTGERLDIFSADGQPLGDAYGLGEITVTSVAETAGQ